MRRDRQARPGRAERGSARLVVFLLFAGLLSGLLVAYTLRTRPPRFPADADHLRSADPSSCLRCHGPGTDHPRGPKHPLNDQCMSCHERI
jgi:hypothetical protein